jgi:copper chaperone CopZ
MRQLGIVPLVVVVAAAIGVGPVRADKVELQGMHICCKACARDIEATLNKVGGVTDIAIDAKAGTVSYSAPKAKAGESVQTLRQAGFYPSAVKVDGVAAAQPKEEPIAGKADELVIKDVHICCGRCKSTIEKLYPGTKVEFPAKDEVKLAGKQLDKNAVLETLRKAGFNGTIAK